MTLSDVLLAAFVLAMIANIIALVRYWRAMRAFQIVLNNLIETQKQFHEIVVKDGQWQKIERPES